MSGLATSSPDPVHIQVAPAASPVALQGGAVTSGASPSGLHGARARGAAGLETVDLGASESRSQAPASSAAAAAAAPAAPGRSKKSKDKGRSAKQQPGVTAGAPAQSVSGSPPSARGSLPLSEPPVEAALDAADEAMVEAWKRQQDTITASIQKEHARKAKKQGKDLDHSLAALQRGAAASASSAAAAGGRSGAQTGAGAAAGAGAWAGAGAGTHDEAAFTDIATAMEAGAGSAGFYSTGGGVGANEDCVLRAARVLEQSLEQETDRTLLAATRTSRIALALTLLGTLIVGIAGLAVAAAGERTAFVFGGTRFANAALFLASSLAFPVLLLGAYADWRIHLRLVLVTALVALAAGSLAALGMIFSFSFSQDSLRSAVLTAYAQLGTEEKARWGSAEKLLVVTRRDLDRAGVMLVFVAAVLLAAGAAGFRLRRKAGAHLSGLHRAAKDRVATFVSKERRKLENARFVQLRQQAEIEHSRSRSALLRPGPGDDVDGGDVVGGDVDGTCTPSVNRRALGDDGAAAASSSTSSSSQASSAAAAAAAAESRRAGGSARASDDVDTSPELRMSSVFVVAGESAARGVREGDLPLTDV